MLADIRSALESRLALRIINGVVDDVFRILNEDVENGAVTLGGTSLAVTVSTAYIGGPTLHICEQYLETRTPDPEGGKYDYKRIAEQKNERSVRTGKPTHQLSRDNVEEGEVPYTGNAIALIDDKLVFAVGCSGLSEESDRRAATGILELLLLGLAEFLTGHTVVVP